jgi:predicted O-linked N-acetylglucosamine transferase (SPINDLY family)
MAERFGHYFKCDQLPKLDRRTESKEPHAKLRVGFISGDFHDHPTMYLLSGVLTRMSPQKVSTHIYSYGPNVQSEYRRNLLSGDLLFRDISYLSDIEASEIIASDRVDILVDLKGYTKDARLGINALRPAPIILNWLGYPGTLGVPALADYIIGDDIVTPEQNSHHFSERIANMPHCYQPNDAIRALSTASRSTYGLPDDAFVFCNFNQTFKLTPQIFSIWCDLLSELPETVLWMRRPDEDVATSRLKALAGAQGIAEHRLIFASHAPLEEHLSRLQLADLALDTYPCNSHTTASDALRAGVPLLTLMGETFASRVAASLLTTLGTPELVATSEEQYRSIATRIVLSSDYMAHIRGRIKGALKTSTLFDPARYARDLELLLVEIWRDAHDTKHPKPKCVRISESKN